MHPPAQQQLSCSRVCVNVHICQSHKQWHIFFTFAATYLRFLCCGGGFAFVIESLPFALFLLLFIIQLCAFFSTASTHLFCFHRQRHTHTLAQKRGARDCVGIDRPRLHLISSNFPFLLLIECTRFFLITYAFAIPIALIRQTLAFSHSPQWYTRKAEKESLFLHFSTPFLITHTHWQGRLSHTHKRWTGVPICLFWSGRRHYPHRHRSDYIPFTLVFATRALLALLLFFFDSKRRLRVLHKQIWALEVAQPLTTVSISRTR